MRMITLCEETGKKSMVNPIHVVRIENNPEKFGFPTMVILDNGEKFFSTLEIKAFSCLWGRAMEDKTSGDVW
jgi:uncharacterized protein YlzI (FlbEa/FlbD family)